MKRLFIVLAVLVATGPLALAQSPGEPVPTSRPEEPQSVAPDTLFLFTPARPLVDSTATPERHAEALGIDILFSNSGFGLGGFYRRPISEKLSWSINLGITGSRNRDEFPERMIDPNPPYAYTYDVPGKVNRVFTFPLTIGASYRVLENALVENFRPYVNAGVGPTMILALPYQYDFFESFGHAKAYFTGAAFVGVGAELGNSQPTLGLNVRYYYIPFKPGVESLQGDPITQFGGLFLTANIGFFR